MGARSAEAPYHWRCGLRSVGSQEFAIRIVDGYFCLHTGWFLAALCGQAAEGKDVEEKEKKDTPKASASKPERRQKERDASKKASKEAGAESPKDKKEPRKPAQKRDLSLKGMEGKEARQKFAASAARSSSAVEAAEVAPTTPAGSVAKVPQGTDRVRPPLVSLTALQAHPARGSKRPGVSEKPRGVKPAVSPEGANAKPPVSPGTVEVTKPPVGPKLPAGDKPPVSGDAGGRKARRLPGGDRCIQASRSEHASLR